MNAETRNSEQSRIAFQMVAVKAIKQRGIPSDQLAPPPCGDLFVQDPDCDMIDEMVQEIVSESKPVLRSQPEQNKQNYKMNASFVQRIVSVQRKNKLSKDKKSAHFLFILVFTFFVCWVNVFFFNLTKMND